MEYAVAEQLVTLLVVGFFALLVLLIGREIVCWYFKINQITKQLADANRTLVAILEALVEAKSYKP